MSLSVHGNFRSTWPRILSVPVIHCPESFGLVLRTSSVQLVYSGDCRPSEKLIAAAKAGAAEEQLATWLLHEATFDAREEANAKLTRHSTTTEALQVASRMGVQGALLTHFSQRYPFVAMEAVNDSAGTVAGAAFDGLCIRVGQFKAFAQAGRIFESFWQKRGEMLERRGPNIQEPRQPRAGAVLPRACFSSVPGNAVHRLQCQPCAMDSVELEDFIDFQSPAVPSAEADGTDAGHEEETTEPVCHTRVDQSVEPLPAQTASVCQVTQLPEREPGAENTHETPVLSGQMQRRASQRKRAREAEDSVPSQQAHTQPEAVSRLRTLTRGLAPPHKEPKDLSVSEDLLDRKSVV